MTFSVLHPHAVACYELDRLAVGAPSPDDRRRYAHVLADLAALADVPYMDAAPGAEGVQARTRAWDRARRHIGSLVGYGIRWPRLAPVLIALDDAWEQERAHQDGVTLGSPEWACEIVGLPVEHYLLYQVARSQLWALAQTVPETSRIDYWFVLERLDALYDPFVRPAVAAPLRIAKPLLHATASAALAELGAYDVDPERLQAVLDLLNSTWAADVATRAGA